MDGNQEWNRFTDVTKGIELATPSQFESLAKIVQTLASKEPQECGFVSHHRGRVIQCDDDAARIMGKTKAEVLQMDYLRIKNPQLRQRSLERLAKTDGRASFYQIGEVVFKVTAFYFNDFAGINLVEDLTNYPEEITGTVINADNAT